MREPLGISTKQGTCSRKRFTEQVSRQCLKFDMALRQGRADSRKDRDIGAQIRRYAEAVGAIRQKELQAREVLMRHGLFRIQFMPYFRFVRYLCRARKQYQGKEFELEAEAATARWTGQGCDRGILVEILLNVFNLRLAKRPEPGVELYVEEGPKSEVRNQKAEVRMKGQGNRTKSAARSRTRSVAGAGAGGANVRNRLVVQEAYHGRV